jgi:hypothetical protein
VLANAARVRQRSNMPFGAISPSQAAGYSRMRPCKYSANHEEHLSHAFRKYLRNLRNVGAICNRDGNTSQSRRSHRGCKPLPQARERFPITMAAMVGNRL